jgi:hypothetical protein
MALCWKDIMKTVKEYINEKKIITSSPDKAYANSLQKQSLIRINDVKRLPIDKESAPFRFEQVYEAIRECL